jgi:hypothetical protein
MTREEAIKVIESSDLFWFRPTDEERVALDVAIEALSEPKTETVLCALADRECPFQGKEFVWCLTCPHISEEDRALLKAVASEANTGEWIFDEEEGEYICSRCSRLADTDTTTGEWGLPRYCGDCGAYMVNNNSAYER